MMAIKRKPKPPVKKKKPPAKTPTPGSATPGSTGGTTTTTAAGQGTTSSDLSSGSATIGTPDLTGATTTANPTPDTAADQSDNELQAFFSSGVGPAYHYDLAAQQASSQSVNAGTGTTGASVQ